MNSSLGKIASSLFYRDAASHVAATHPECSRCEPEGCSDADHRYYDPKLMHPTVVHSLQSPLLKSQSALGQYNALHQQDVPPVEADPSLIWIPVSQRQTPEDRLLLSLRAHDYRWALFVLNAQLSVLRGSVLPRTPYVLHSTGSSIFARDTKDERLLWLVPPQTAGATRSNTTSGGLTIYLGPPTPLTLPQDTPPTFDFSVTPSFGTADELVLVHQEHTKSPYKRIRSLSHETLGITVLEYNESVMVRFFAHQRETVVAQTGNIASLPIVQMIMEGPMIYVVQYQPSRDPQVRLLAWERKDVLELLFSPHEWYDAKVSPRS